MGFETLVGLVFCGLFTSGYLIGMVGGRVRRGARRVLRVGSLFRGLGMLGLVALVRLVS